MKAGKDWILDKISSKFAFPGMCQEKSFIPLDIWKAGPATTDLVESAHWNSYLEGVGCSLTSGVEKAEHVDQLRLTSAQTYMATGIYSSNTPTDGLHTKRESKRLAREDKQIDMQNEKLSKAHKRVEKAVTQLQKIPSSNVAAVTRAEQMVHKAEACYRKVANQAEVIAQKAQGSGSVNLTLPI
ncbi:hypothetical protein C8R42DRAFT_637076 [Lentinula raphanica]|nr:hypothetical protein C8R42DRAFT_637076 [Lentinula raphanica]